MKGCVPYTPGQHDRRWPDLDLSGITTQEITRLKSLHQRNPKEARRQAEAFTKRKK